MTTYVAFLRGINVGAHNRMKMDDLRELCESLGFENVRTYIQSGNVAFESSGTDARTLEIDLENAIQSSFDYDTSVIIRTCEELADIVDRQPFEAPADEGTKLYVTFLAEAPDDGQIESLMAAQNEAEEFAVDDSTVYSQLDKEALGNGRFTDVGTVLDIPATRRTWNVVERVLQLAST